MYFFRENQSKWINLNKAKKSGLSKLHFQISGQVTYLSETASVVPLANITNNSSLHQNHWQKSIRVMRENFYNFSTN